jgi:hypothetical protein
MIRPMSGPGARTRLRAAPTNVRSWESNRLNAGRSVNRLLTAAPNVLFVDERRGIALQRKIVHGLVLGLRRNRR